MAKQKQTMFAKVIIAGESSTGKTTLAKRLVTGQFIINTLLTLGVEFHIFETHIKENLFRIQLWDLAGQKRFLDMKVFEEYSRGAHGVILAFDLTRIETFETLVEWHDVATKKSNPLIFLVGTKCDLTECKD